MHYTTESIVLLGKLTAAGYKDTLKALNKTEYNVDDAIELLREQGIISPEKAEETIKNREIDKNSPVRCPICGYDDFDIQKRGFTITTGIIGMNKMKRVYRKCMYKW